MPQRIQRQRTRGWRKPDNCVIVTRPGKFGNPFTVADAIDMGFAETAEQARDVCVTAFRSWIGGSDAWWMGPRSTATRNRILESLAELRGKDLACYCPEGAACHADALIELSNRADEVRELTPDNIHELFGWIESGKPHYAPGMVVDGLSVFGAEGRQVALFGDSIVRDVAGFHVRKAAAVAGQ
jgi:hypothetical protein